MPDRDVHVYCAYKYLKMTGKTHLIDSVSQIETLIDHPERTKGMLRHFVRENCSNNSSWECQTAHALMSGMRVKGVMTHDWRSLRGRRLLYRIVDWFYGSESSDLVKLHYILDTAYRRGIISLREKYPECPGIVRFVVENCMDLL